VGCPYNDQVSRRWFLVLALATGALVVGAVLVNVWWRRPGLDIEQWRTGPPPARWAAREKQDALWRDEGLRRTSEHTYVPLEEISVELQLAVLVSEDINFFGHGPIDLSALREVATEWWRGARLRGGSTISQQLARILFLSKERSLSRKLREVRLASWLEGHLGKRRVLELYLNVVEFGPGVFGAQAATRRYFETSAANLDAEGAASLAAAIPAPGRDNPDTGSERWASRRRVILARVSRAGWLRARLQQHRDLDAGNRTSVNP
jgi:monofunctional biosynthetic peptidoglycan transglycosylase